MSEEAKKVWNTVGAGPRMLKLAKEALQELTRQHNCFIEKYGVRGVSEHSSTLWSPFGVTVREDVTAAFEKLGEEFGWEINAINYKHLIERCKQETAILIKNTPVVDQTVSPEEDAERDAKNQAAELERQIAEAEKDTKQEAIERKLRAQYPHAIPADASMSVNKRAGANLKAELQAVWPWMRWSVTTDYNSLRVEWILGPTVDQVKEIAKKFEHGYYNASEDIHETDHSAYALAVKNVLGSVQFMSLTRKYEPEGMIEALSRKLCGAEKVVYHGAYTKLFEIDDKTVGDIAYQMLYDTPFEYRTIIGGVERDTEGEHRNTYKIVLEKLPEAVNPEPLELVKTSAGHRIQHNDRLDGTEIIFAGKPSFDMITKLKRSGWRATKNNPEKIWIWYKRYSPQTWAEAHRLCGLAEPGAQVQDPAAGMVLAEERAMEDRNAEMMGLTSE
jgi:hypothetical protein